MKLKRIIAGCSEFQYKKGSSYRGVCYEKKAYISLAKRQITIPIEFYNTVGIENEVECYIHNNAIVIKPVRENDGTFDEEILADLIKKGYSGNELLTQFENARKQIRLAVEKILDESRKAAQNPDKYDSCEDIFVTS